MFMFNYHATREYDRNETLTIDSILKGLIERVVQLEKMLNE